MRKDNIFVAKVYFIRLMDIAASISARRKTLGISQNDLAEMSGVSLATIKNIERGKGNPSFETVEKILAVLGMEILLKVRSPFDKQ